MPSRCHTAGSPRTTISAGCDDPMVWNRPEVRWESLWRIRAEIKIETFKLTTFWRSGGGGGWLDGITVTVMRAPTVGNCDTVAAKIISKIGIVAIAHSARRAPNRSCSLNGCVIGLRFKNQLRRIYWHNRSDKLNFAFKKSTGHEKPAQNHIAYDWWHWLNEIKTITHSIAFSSKTDKQMSEKIRVDRFISKFQLTLMTQFTILVCAQYIV